MYNPFDSMNVYYKVSSLENNVTVEGTITTNLPSDTTPITMQAVRTSGSSSNACSFDISQLTLNCLS
jgi:S-adenosylmethionine synthetase